VHNQTYSCCVILEAGVYERARTPFLVHLNTSILQYCIWILHIPLALPAIAQCYDITFNVVTLIACIPEGSMLPY